MKPYQKVVGAALAAGLMLLTSACSAVTIDGETAPNTDGALQGNGKIGLSVSTLNNPFFVSLSDGAREAARELGADLIVIDAGDDPAKQTNDIEDFISKNITVLLVNPVDSDAVAPAVSDAKAKGIRIISIDRVVNGVEVDCQIASDNVAGASMATEYLTELIGEGAKVADLQGVPGTSAAIDRGQGFHDIADSKLNVVASQTAHFNRAEGLMVMENILQADSAIQGVFAHNDEMALGAIEAIDAVGREIQVVGFDATEDAVAAVQAGRMAATVAQQPELMGRTAVETAMKMMDGEVVPDAMPVEVELITQK